MLQRIAHGLGGGVLAGLAGTAAITATMAAQRLLRGEPPLDPTPAKAVRNTLGIDGVDERGRALLAAKVHWEYGTAWGVARALLGALGVRGPAATAAHALALHGAAMALLPRARVAPPASEQPVGDQLLLLAHHAVYAAAAGAVYDRVSRGRRPLRLGRRRAMRPYARLAQHDETTAREPQPALVGDQLA